jgi:hypothetical protein
MKGKLKELFEKAQSAAEHDTSINGAERDCAAEPEAREVFAEFRRKLLDLPRWNSESALTSFAHFDADGREIEAQPLAEGDFIRIALKGSGKYDWVRVARIEQTDDEAVVTVSPEFDPTAEQPDRETTSHFFTSAATNNFCLQRDQTKILFYVIGLEEKTNLGETGNTLETARNALVANLGYYLGIQKGEWKTFCRNFLELEKE